MDPAGRLDPHRGRARLRVPRVKVREPTHAPPNARRVFRQRRFRRGRVVRAVRVDVVALPDLDDVKATLDGSFAVKWRDELNDLGSWSLTLQNNDPALASMEN